MPKRICSRLFFLCAVLCTVATGIGFAGNSAAVTFTIEFVDNVEGDFAARGWLDSQSLFQRNIAAAAAQWGAVLASDADMLLRVRADRSLARTGGTYSNGLTVGMVGQRDLVEPGPLSLVRTGTNPGTEFFGYDILVGINSEFVDFFYWIDPQPEQRTSPVPGDRGDFISVIMHELGHGLGMAGARSFASGATYGTLPVDFLSLFDSFSSFGGNGLVQDTKGNPNPMFFNGDASTALFGSPVLLANVGQLDFLFSQNFYHLGTCTDPPLLTNSLMNGCSIPNGQRVPISAIDVAVYDDLGYETLPEPSAAFAAVLATLAFMHRVTGSRPFRPARAGSRC